MFSILLFALVATYILRTFGNIGNRGLLGSCDGFATVHFLCSSPLGIFMGHWFAAWPPDILIYNLIFVKKISPQLVLLCPRSVKFGLHAVALVE